MSSIVGGDDDVISNLPDTVICHILSFLLSKEVVATSILSKRWTHLWRSVPVINFKGEYPIELCDEEALIRFNNVVYSVLLSRGSNSIKSFSLKIHYDDYHLEGLGSPSVLIWINHVVQHNVESVDLHVEIEKDYFPKLPISILSCKSLVVLNLEDFAVEGFSYVRLSSLKILSLKFCKFLDARDLVLFLSESLSLSKLIRAQMPHTFWHFPLKALHKVEELYIEINKVYRNFDKIPTFHNLTKLKLHSINSNWDLLFQMLNRCPNFQYLELSQGTSFGFGRKARVQKNWVIQNLFRNVFHYTLKLDQFGTSQANKMRCN